MGLEGIQHVCNMLLHPEGPKGIASLILDGAVLAVSGSRDDVMIMTATSSDNRIGVEEMGLLCDTLLHPEGPKGITRLSLNGAW